MSKATSRYIVVAVVCYHKIKKKKKKKKKKGAWDSRQYCQKFLTCRVYRCESPGTDFKVYCIKC